MMAMATRRLRTCWSISGTAMSQAAEMMGTKTWPPTRGVGDS